MALSLEFESSLEKSLQTFLKDETLDSKGKYKCDKCKQESNAKIKNEICKLP